jgi:FkbM family methyltransferase
MTNRPCAQSLTRFNVNGTCFQIDDPGGTVAAETFSDNGYEPAVVGLLDRIARHTPAAVFCDIGALHGYYAALVAARFGGWRIVAFEPNPEAHAVLQRNFDIAEIQGEARCQALNESGEALYFKGRTIVDPGIEGATRVTGIRFDDVLNELPSGDLVVKVDVHGAEALVLNGMREALKTRVAAALVEVHARHILVGTQDYADVLEPLETAGLNVYEVLDFRYAVTPGLQPLIGRARADFLDFNAWTAEQVSRERLLLAVHPRMSIG